MIETCELSALSPAERTRWIGWQPTPRDLMLIGRVSEPKVIQRRIAKLAVVVVKPQRITRTDAETLLILAGYKPTRGVCRALETDATYRAAIHRTAWRMTEGDEDKRAELSAAFDALNRD